MSREQRQNNKVEFLHGVSSTLFVAGLASLTISISFGVSEVVKKVTKGYTSWELGVGTALFGVSALALTKFIANTEGRLQSEIIESIANSVSHQQERDRAMWSVPSGEQLERQVPPSPLFHSRPTACSGCTQYKGWSGNGFVCAMHPYGPGDQSNQEEQPKSCPDWEGILASYRIVRLQGSGITSLWVCPDQFQGDEEHDVPLADDVANVIENSQLVTSDQVKRLMKHFRVGSVNGLIGQTFTSNRFTAYFALRDLVEKIPD